MTNPGKSDYDRQIEARTIARGLPIDTGRTYSPEEAQAMLAKLVANPIPANNGNWKGGYEGPGFRSYWVRPRGQESGYHIEDPRIEDQTAKPEKPETRYVSASTYGKTIPISMGKRRLEGNLILCSALVPRLVGNKDYTIEYEIPIYEDPPVDPDKGYRLDPSGGFPDDPEEPPPEDEECGKGDECDTRDDGGEKTTEYFWTVVCGDLRYVEVCSTPGSAQSKGGPYQQASSAMIAGKIQAGNCYPGDHGGGRVGVYSRDKSEDGSYSDWTLVDCDVVTTGPQD